MDGPPKMDKMGHHWYKHCGKYPTGDVLRNARSDHWIFWQCSKCGMYAHFKSYRPDGPNSSDLDWDIGSKIHDSLKSLSNHSAHYIDIGKIKCEDIVCQLVLGS
jgi:hypothetical protein